VARSAGRDAAWVGLGVLGYFACASAWDWSEHLAGFARRYEPWQLDEMPLTLLGLSIGLCWFAARRVADLRRELQERVAAQAQAAALLAHNRDLAQRLIQVQESERRALARELHDELGQHSSAIRAEASFLLHGATTPGPQLRASAQRIAASAETLHHLVRDMLKRLRPQTLDSLGLAAALQELCENWEEQTGIACGFFPALGEVGGEDARAMAVFRLVQEALTNVARHAQASQVRVSLRESQGDWLLVVQDDGQGLHEPPRTGSGLGLIGMHERVAALHGQIRLQVPAGQGLRIEVQLPHSATP